jgi:hypothetical protein
VRIGRLTAWGAAAALVVLCARTLSYALAPPTILGDRLQTAAGGPQLVTVALTSTAIAAAVSVAVVGLAALGVRERLALAPELVVAPTLRPLRMAVRFAAVFVVTSAIFALLESYLHWRAGLGWHGLHCLVGPVHRDAIPLLAALSAVAVAIGTAIEHVFAWIRRTISRLRGRRVPSRPAPRAAIPRARAHPLWRDRTRAARGPPAFVLPVQSI